MATGGISRWEWWRADPGHTYYLPELYYFPAHLGALRRPAAVPLDRAAHITARCLVRWSDHVSATSTYWRKPEREGPLPATKEEREALVDELFRWLAETSAEPVFCAGMGMWLGKQWVMDAHDGFPGPLHLTPDQFDTLRDRLEEAGLPRDLYYPILEQRAIVEPILMSGGPAPGRYEGVVRGRRFYSPQEWAHRDEDAIAALRVPSEDERLDTFAAACDAFKGALTLRSRELSEPGKDIRGDELREAIDLLGTVRDALYSTYARRHGLTTPEATRLVDQRESMAGWQHVSSAFEAVSTALPALRRLHGDAGFVWWIGSQRIQADDEIAEWALAVWLPEPNRSLSYRLVNGVLFGPPSEVTGEASERTPIWPLDQDAPHSLLDSREALARAAEAGGREFCERTKGQLGSIRLIDASDDSLAWLVSYGNWHPPAELRVQVDARTGEVLAVEEEPPGPPPPQPL